MEKIVGVGCRFLLALFLRLKLLIYFLEKIGNLGARSVGY